MRLNIWCDYGRLKMPNTTTTSPQTDQVDAQSYRVGPDQKVVLPPIGEEVTRTLEADLPPCWRPLLGRPARPAVNVYDQP